MRLTDIDHSKYRKADKSLTPFQSNVVSSVVMIPVVMLLLGAFTAFHGFLFPTRPVAFVLCLFAVVAAYEVLQGALLSLACVDGFGSIKFTVRWRSLALRCNCAELLTKRGYLSVVMLPGLITIMSTYVVSIYFANAELLYTCLLMAIGAGGDMYNAARLIGEPRDILVEDHPDFIGSIVYYPVESLCVGRRS